jgi:hypothetical protein
MCRVEDTGEPTVRQRLQPSTATRDRKTPRQDAANPARLGLVDVRRYDQEALLITFTPSLSRRRRRSRNVPLKARADLRAVGDVLPRQTRNVGA